MASSARPVPGESRLIFCEQGVAAVIAGVPDDSIAELLGRLRAAATSADVAEAVAAAFDLPAGIAAAAPVSGPPSEAILVGDLDVEAQSPVGRTHLNAKNAVGVVRQQIAPSVTTIRIGDEGSTPAWSELVSGVVPGAGLVVEVDPVPAQVPRPVRSDQLASEVGVRPSETPASPPVETSVEHASPDRTDDAPETAVLPAVGEFEAISLVALADAPPDRTLARAPLPVQGEDRESSEGRGDEAAEGAGPVVVKGINCAIGHFNSPRAANCVWCGRGMAQVSHHVIEGERPPLGVLVVDEQATFTLDAGYMLGRQPSQHPAVDGVVIRELVLADPDRSVSRVHASVTLEGWDVVVADEGSGNGTWIVDPSGARPSEQLTPHAPHVLAPGDFIHIGPHRLTFHSHHRR